MKGIDMKKIGSVISLLFPVLLFVLAVNAHGGEWILFGENGRGSFLYDKASISKTNNGMVAVDMKVIESSVSTEEFAVRIPLKGVSVTLYRDVINCRTRFYECKRIRYYDRNGKLLADTETDEAADTPPKLRPIPLGTQIESLANIVCK
jgi:hypothetical protein